MPTVIPFHWYPRRGEVYWANLDKRRPVIVISIDALNQVSRDVCVILLTSVHHKQFRVRVPVPAGDGGLPQDSWAKTDQVTSIPNTRLVPPALGVVSPTTLQAIEQSVKLSLGL